MIRLSFGRLIKCLPASFRDRYRDCWNRWLGLLWRPRLPQNPDGRVYLHLGCGYVIHPRFINVDVLPLRHVHYVQSVERLHRFRDDSVDLIYSSHCLEHFSHQAVPSILVEWRRVLKPGGILRLSVPDFDAILKIYQDNGFSVESIQATLMGGQDYASNYHKIIFNHGSLTRLFKDAGFVNLTAWQPGADELTAFADWSNRKVKIGGKEYDVSLNLQAEKGR
jgi:predicted SAM-dependent methyltransferase